VVYLATESSLMEVVLQNRILQERPAIMKTREDRREELKQLAAMPNGIDKLYWILTTNFIPSEKLPIGTLLIEAILDHE
jgi:hypothetical protein